MGKFKFNVKELGVDFMSISGHKFYGPKGVGILYVKKGKESLLEPTINGGGQEKGLRSGTLAPALCVGLGEAADIARRELPEEHDRIKTLRKRLVKGLESIWNIELNGNPTFRYEGNVNVSFKNI